MKYEVGFTRLGEAFARAKSTRDKVIEAALREIAEFCEADEALNGMATFSVGDQMFVAIGRGDFTLLVDTASLEEGPVLDAGPFKGRRVMLPRPDSER